MGERLSIEDDEPMSTGKVLISRTVSLFARMGRLKSLESGLIGFNSL